MLYDTLPAEASGADALALRDAFRRDSHLRHHRFRWRPGLAPSRHTRGAPNYIILFGYYCICTSAFRHKRLSSRPVHKSIDMDFLWIGRS